LFLISHTGNGIKSLDFRMLVGEKNYRFAVAIDGNCAVVGAPYEDGGTGDPWAFAGAAYIYE
jgi:hypothetical protein